MYYKSWFFTYQIFSAFENTGFTEYPPESFIGVMNNLRDKTSLDILPFQFSWLIAHPRSSETSGTHDFILFNLKIDTREFPSFVRLESEQLSARALGVGAFAQARGPGRTTSVGKNQIVRFAGGVNIHSSIFNPVATK